MTTTKLVTCLGLFTLLLSSPSSAASRETTDADGAVRAIEGLIDAVEAANNAGDVERWVSYFTADAVYMAPGAPAVTTREGLIEVAEAGFRHDAAIQIEPLEIRVCGDWAFARNEVTGSVTLEKSREVVAVDVKQIVVYSRDDDGIWKIARMISNSNTQ